MEMRSILKCQETSQLLLNKQVICIRSYTFHMATSCLISELTNS